MKGLKRYAWILLLLSLWGCGEETDLVVYADPWLAEFADFSIETYQNQHPEAQIELKVLSSEMIAQHLKYGQPMDVFLSCGNYFEDAERFGDYEIAAKKGRSVALGGDKIAWVQVLNPAQTQAFQSEGCTMVAATHRPLERLSRQWKPAVFEDSTNCLIVANFQAQTADYLQGGWVDYGYVFQSYAKNHPEKLRILDTSPLHSNLFQAFAIKDAPHPQAARDFLEILASEKSRKWLVSKNFIL